MVWQSFLSILSSSCPPRRACEYSASCFDVLSNLQFIDIRVEDAVHETDARRLVWVLVGQLNVDFPDAAFEGRCVLAVSKPIQLKKGDLGGLAEGN